MTGTRIILVRHGQTAWNRMERFRGREDLPLNSAGRRQAEAAGRYIATHWSPAAVYCSPLLRAVETAQAIGRACGLPVHPWRDLVDIHYGQWQGLTPSEAAESYPEQYWSWLQRPHEARIPDGESLAAVLDRAFRAVQTIIETHLGGSVVIVGHTVVNRVLLCAVLGLDISRFWRLQQATAAINVFDWDGSDFTLLSLNDTCHLQRDLAVRWERARETRSDEDGVGE